MIGRLPTTIIIDGTAFEIRSDYRNILQIMCAFNDEELSVNERYEVMLRRLYVDHRKIDGRNYEEAVKKAVEFIDGGNVSQKKTIPRKLYDWEQDEQIIFSAINKVAGREVRSDSYMHWWTFLGLFYEIGEGVFSTVVSIRDKQQRNKKLEKYEQEFLKENADMVKLRARYSTEEEAERERLRKLLGIKND